MKNIPNWLLERIVAAYFIMKDMKEERHDGIKVLSCNYNIFTNVIEYTAQLPGKIHNMEVEITLSE